MDFSSANAENNSISDEMLLQESVLGGGGANIPTRMIVCRIQYTLLKIQYMYKLVKKIPSFQIPSNKYQERQQNQYG
jgi:hypothetical protein